MPSSEGEYTFTLEVPIICRLDPLAQLDISIPQLDFGVRRLRIMVE